MKVGDKVLHSGMIGTFKVLAISTDAVKIVRHDDTGGEFWAHPVVLSQEVEKLCGAYVCHAVGSGEPTKRHVTLGQAKAEAERLARKQNKEVRVLQIVGTMKPQEKPVIWESLI